MRMDTVHRPYQRRAGTAGTAAVVAGAPGGLEQGRLAQTGVPPRTNSQP